MTRARRGTATKASPNPRADRTRAAMKTTPSTQTITPASVTVEVGVRAIELHRSEDEEGAK
jgi:hypothetical protein